MALKIYKDPQSFLNESEAFLVKKEMENNLLLGNCYNIILENRNYEGCYFLNSFAGEHLKASSLMLSSKIILFGDDEVAIEEIFQFYRTNNVDFKGVIGNRFSSELFAKLSSKKILQTRVTFIQSLDKIKEVSLAEGSFELATTKHLDLLSDWTIQFFAAENLFPKRTPEQIQFFIKNLIEHKNLFCWMKDAEPVSMGAIIRKTKHTAIIGLVYTPAALRAKGFGKSFVQGLSTHILKNGFKESGLLVYDSNSIAQNIYGQIGYNTVAELSDIDFV